MTGGPDYPVLLPWQILSVHEPDETFFSLFGGRVKPKFLEKFAPDCAAGMKLEKCCVGECKDALDESDPLQTPHAEFLLEIGKMTSIMLLLICLKKKILFFLVVMRIACQVTPLKCLHTIPKDSGPGK